MAGFVVPEWVWGVFVREVSRVCVCARDSGAGFVVPECVWVYVCVCIYI